MGPGAAATLNFAGYTEQVQISVKTGDGVPAKVMEQMKSVAEWIATFGLRPELCLGMHRVYARRDRKKGLAYPTAELLAQMEASQERIAQKNSGPLSRIRTISTRGWRGQQTHPHLTGGAPTWAHSVQVASGQMKRRRPSDAAKRRRWWATGLA